MVIAQKITKILSIKMIYTDILTKRGIIHKREHFLCGVDKNCCVRR